MQGFWVGVGIPQKSHYKDEGMWGNTRPEPDISYCILGRTFSKKQEPKCSLNWHAKQAAISVWIMSRGHSGPSETEGQKQTEHQGMNAYNKDLKLSRQVDSSKR